MVVSLRAGALHVQIGNARLYGLEGQWSTFDVVPYNRDGTAFSSAQITALWTVRALRTLSNGASIQVRDFVTVSSISLLFFVRERARSDKLPSFSPPPTEIAWSERSDWNLCRRCQPRHERWVGILECWRKREGHHRGFDKHRELRSSRCRVSSFCSLTPSSLFLSTGYWSCLHVHVHRSHYRCSRSQHHHSDLLSFRIQRRR